MARIKNIFFFLIFAIFLALGISISKVIFGDSPSSPDTQASDSKLGNEETYLVIGVDDLSQPKAILESAWLITIKSSSSQIDLVPLYPENIPPHEPILISTNDFDEYKDIEVIKKHEVNWAGVILLDMVGLNMVVEVAGERLTPVSTYDKNQHLGLPRAWEFPDESLQKQKNIIVFLCGNTQPFFSYEMIQYLMEFIPDHYRSSLSVDELWSNWQSLCNMNFNLKCIYSWQVSP